MTQTRKPKNSLPLPAVLLGVLVVAVLLVICLGSAGKPSAETAQVQDGIVFLESLEQKDPDVVRQARQVIYKRRMAEQKEELTAQVKSGEIDPFPLFQDYAVLGDSRAIGFYYSDFLDEERVFAKGGNTIRAIDSRLADLSTLNPSYVFLCYGLNDVSIGFWDNGEEHAVVYMEKIQLIRETLPDATIVVSSILPTTEAAYSVSKAWKKIPEWNKALKAACAENGVLFADCDWVFEEYHKYWVEDGQHLRPAVYPYWGGQLIITALYGEVGNES